MKATAPLLALASLALAPVLAESPARTAPVAAPESAPADDLAYGEDFDEDAAALPGPSLARPPMGELPEPSAEAQAVARRTVNFVKRVIDILRSEQGEADKLAALQALKPAAAELGKAAHAIPMDELRAAGLPLLEELGEDADLPNQPTGSEALDTILEDIISLTNGGPDPSILLPPENIALNFISTLYRYTSVMKDTSLSEPERAEAINDLCGSLYQCHLWCKRSGRTEELRALLQGSKGLDKALEEFHALPEPARGTRVGEHDDIREILSELVAQVLDTIGMPEAPALVPPMSPEDAMATARAGMALTQEIVAILRSDTDTAAKQAALAALKPQASNVGLGVRHIPFLVLHELFQGKKIEMPEEVVEERGLHELLPVLDELGCLLRGEPDSSLPVPTEDIARQFLKTLNDYVATIRNESLREEEKTGAIRDLRSRLSTYARWAKRSGKGDELRALLQQGEGFKSALATVEAIAPFRVDGHKSSALNRETQHFRAILDAVLVQPCPAEPAAAVQDGFSPKALQGAQEYVDILKELVAIAAADSGKDAKLAAIRALMPRVDAFGRNYADIGAETLRQAAKSLVSAEEFGRLREAISSSLSDDGELEDAMTEMEELVRKHLEPR